MAELEEFKKVENDSLLESNSSPPPPEDWMLSLLLESMALRQSMKRQQRKQLYMNIVAEMKKWFPVNLLDQLRRT